MSQWILAAEETRILFTMTMPCWVSNCHRPANLDIRVPFSNLLPQRPDCPFWTHRT